MKTINSLTHSDDGKPAIPVPNRNIRGKMTPVPFSRQARHVADGVFVESTLGAKLFIPWAVFETADILLAFPKNPTL